MGTRLVVHYYYLPTCQHCIVFRREVWDPLRQGLTHQGITFHEIDASTYDGSMQATKHAVDRYPCLTFSQSGPNHPQFILRNGNESVAQLIDKIRLLLSK